MKPVLVRLCGYILELEDDCLYVGITLNINQRLSQHFDQQDSSIWTTLHKPIRLLHVEFDIDEDWENTTTLTLMMGFGIDKVRGGAWCKETIVNNPIAPKIEDSDSDCEDEEEDMCINEEYFQHQIEYYAEQLFLLEAEIDALESEL